MIECKICGESFEIIQWNHLEKHGLTVSEYKKMFPNSPIASKDFIKKSLNIKNKTCRYCGEKFKSLGELGGHVSTHHGNGGKALMMWLEENGPWNKGLTWEEDNRMSRPWLGKKRDPPWNKGLGTPDLYGYEFTEELKEYIRYLDEYRCQGCFRNQREIIREEGEKLSVHHIDGDKGNNNLNNLLSLCRRCHSVKTNRDCKGVFENTHRMD